MRRTLVLALTLAAATVLAPAAADARIVVDKSIAGVRMGMSRHAVLARLGKPDDRGRNRDPAVGRYLTLVWYSHRRHEAAGATKVYVSFHIRHGKVRGAFEVGTSSRFERTSKGVGVGTTLRRLRARVREQLFCVHFGGGTMRCETRPPEGAPAVTRFDVFRSRGHGWRVEGVRLGAITRPRGTRPAPRQPPENPNFPSAITVLGCPCHAGDFLELSAPAGQDESHALIVDYTWDMGVPGDPSAHFSSGDDEFADWAYSAAGTYHVTLVVTDEGGGRKTLTTDVVVDP
jgi:hypothetical protein